MDRDLLRQSVSFHGENLLSLLKCEQNENPDFKHLASDLYKSLNQRDKDEQSPVLEQFIARKADLLFAPSWKISEPADEWQEELGGSQLFIIRFLLYSFLNILKNEFAVF